MTKIIDSFLFFNEVDLLDLRLNILYDYVDCFVITESDRTFSGNEKQFNYLKNKNKFKKFEDKIIYNQITIPENISITWDREIFQRNSALSLIREKFNEEDLIITSDIDEIPSVEVLKNYSDWFKIDNLYHLKQDMYMYYLNNFKTSQWFGSRICSLSFLNDKTIDDIRQATEDEDKLTGFIIENGGWHFTYLGGKEMIKYKLESFSHQEYNNDWIKLNIEKCINNNIDILGRNESYKLVSINENDFPEYIVQNIEKYSHLIKDVSN